MTGMPVCSMMKYEEFVNMVCDEFRDMDCECPTNGLMAEYVRYGEDESGLNRSAEPMYYSVTLAINSGCEPERVSALVDETIKRLKKMAIPDGVRTNWHMMMNSAAARLEVTVTLGESGIPSTTAS